MALADRLKKRAQKNANQLMQKAVYRFGKKDQPAGLPADMDDVQVLRFGGQIPNPFGKEPIYEFAVELQAEEQLDGENINIRAQMRTNIELPKPESGKESLPAPEASNQTSLVERGQVAANELARRVLTSPAVQQLAPILERKVTTKLEVNASTTPLSNGALELVPAGLKKLGMGTSPAHLVANQPVMETWTGRVNEGLAQAALLRIDKDQLPEELQNSLKDQDFHLSISMVNVFEDD